jgi:hypothetical protein
MRGAGGARGASAVARHLPPRPVEPLTEAGDELWPASEPGRNHGSVPRLDARSRTPRRTAVAVKEL